MTDEFFRHRARKIHWKDLKIGDLIENCGRDGEGYPWEQIEEIRFRDPYDQYVGCFYTDVGRGVWFGKDSTIVSVPRVIVCKMFDETIEVFEDGSTRVNGRPSQWESFKRARQALLASQYPLKTNKIQDVVIALKGRVSIVRDRNALKTRAAAPDKRRTFFEEGDT